MVDLQTEALIGIAVIGIALVSFGLYPIAKLALSQRKPRTARVSATSEERDGLVTQKKQTKLKPKKASKAPARVPSDDDDDDVVEDEHEQYSDADVADDVGEDEAVPAPIVAEPALEPAAEEPIKLTKKAAHTVSLPYFTRALIRQI